MKQGRNCEVYHGDRPPEPWFTNIFLVFISVFFFFFSILVFSIPILKKLVFQGRIFD